VIRPSPLERFLGVPGETASPFDILGVAPETCTPRRVREALARRLERLGRTPEGLSHDADEVRLALYAAAAQLLDPSVREALTRGDPASAQPATSQPDAFDFAAMHALARAGGFNAQSRRWLALLAHAHGLRPAQVARRVEVLAHRPHTWARARPADQDHGRPTADTPLPRRRRRRGLPVSAVVSIASVTTLIAVIVGTLVVKNAARPAADGARARPEASVPAARPDQPRSSDRARPATATPSESPSGATSVSILPWLERARDELATDPGQAVWRFERAVDALAAGWPDLSAGARTRAVSLVRGLMHRVEPASASGRRAIDAVGAAARALTSREAPISDDAAVSAVWSAAVLALLANESDAPDAIRRTARAVWRDSLGEDPPPASTFDAAALRSAPAVARRLIERMRSAPAGSASGLEAWARCVARVAPDDDARDRVILTAVEGLLTSGASVDRDARAHAALVALLASVAWAPRPEGPPRPAHRDLLAWFDEPAIGAPALAVVTEWLARSSGAGGVEPGMTLSRVSIPESRVALRERYARAWGLEPAVGAQGFAVVWARTARESLASIPAGSTAAPLARAVVAARLSAAAAARWRGESDTANALLMDPISPALTAQRPVPTRRGVVRDADRQGDGEWARRFLSAPARDDEARVRLLAELGRRAGPLGPIDAAVLARAAARSPIGPVRDRAADVVRRRAAEAGVVVAILDAMPDATRTDATASLVSTVAGRATAGASDPAWPRQARAALVARALDLLEPTDEAAVIDALERQTAHAYAAALGEPPSRGERARGFGAERAAAATAGDLDERGASEIAADLARAWTEQAERFEPNPRAPVPIGTVRRRWDARVSLAAGAAERFAAHQRTLVDAMAAVVAAERPSRAADAARILADLAGQRRVAGSLPDQLLATELAGLRLWAIRLGADADDPVPTGLLREQQPGMAGPGAPRTVSDVILHRVGGARLDAPAARRIRRLLEGLDPQDARQVFGLAEEASLVATVTADPAWREAARDLFALAVSLDERAAGDRRVSAGACLALAELSTRRDERRWLVALARSFDPAIEPPAEDAAASADEIDARARLAVAEALELARTGEYARARRALQTPGADAVLDRFGPMIGGADAFRALIESQPTCRQCRNERVVPDPANPGGPPRLCPTCGGSPGPDLDDDDLVRSLRLEQALVGGGDGSWAAALAITGAAPVRDVDPAALTARSP